MLRRFGWKLVLGVIVLSIAIGFILPQHPLPGCLKETGISFVWNEKDKVYQYPYKDWERVQDALKVGGFSMKGNIDYSDPNGRVMIGGGVWELGTMQIIEGPVSSEKKECFVQVPNIFERIGH